MSKNINILFCLLTLVFAFSTTCKAGFFFNDKKNSNLPVIELTVDGHSLQTEVASTDEQKSIGLMHRKFMPINTGMLFVFKQPQAVSFWMRDTYIPLTIAFIDFNGRILEFRDMKPLDETPIDSKTDDVFYALEVNQGWFKQNGIKADDIIKGLDQAPNAQ